ncbi:hypothetical protein NE237_021280 [Protea cynaroides]|uniref:Uncharacterized protein n=1 Tax=Protea cynaroides TaxID=273540 RepID=A0A9Q0K477_9MAGN|nr:hypothetical protein NE237_021280 [Protea cynaroides]
MRFSTRNDIIDVRRHNEQTEGVPLCGLLNKAMEAYQRLKLGLKPDENTAVSFLSACASLGFPAAAMASGLFRRGVSKVSAPASTLLRARTHASEAEAQLVQRPDQTT